MIKINDKAFAASTILYGVLAMSLIILMLILATMKSSKDMNQDLVEQIEYKLNNCVDKEVELQKCELTNSSCIQVSEIYNACVEENNNNLQK